jgi:hypothetical protein
MPTSDAPKKSTSGRRTAAVGGMQVLQSMKPLARATDRLWLYETTRGKREFSQLVRSVLGPEGAKSSSTGYDITVLGHCELESVGSPEQRRVVGHRQREMKMEDAARMALVVIFLRGARERRDRTGRSAGRSKGGGTDRDNLALGRIASGGHQRLGLVHPEVRS